MFLLFIQNLDEAECANDRDYYLSVFIFIAFPRTFITSALSCLRDATNPKLVSVLVRT